MDDGMVRRDLLSLKVIGGDGVGEILEILRTIPVGCCTNED